MGKNEVLKREEIAIHIESEMSFMLLVNKLIFSLLIIKVHCYFNRSEDTNLLVDRHTLRGFRIVRYVGFWCDFEL